MPIYEYQCTKCSHQFDVFVKGFNYDDSELKCESCGKQTCQKLFSAPQIKIGEDRPDRYERKEQDHKKKVKDPERARRLRKKAFGTEGVSITKSPYYKKDKRVKAQGASDISKKDFIQAAARNPNAVAAAQKIVKKSGG